MTVIGGDQGQGEFAGDFQHSGIHPLLFGDFVLLDLQVEAPVAENRFQFLCGLQGFPFIAAGQEERDFALQAGAEGDEAFIVFLQQFLIDSRPVVESFEISRGYQLHQIAVANQVLGQKDQVERSFGNPPGGLLEAAAGSHIDLTADDGLDPVSFRLLVKFDDPEHGTMVRNRQRGHAVVLRQLEELFQTDSAVQKTELGMQMEMHKIGVFHTKCFKF